MDLTEKKEKKKEKLPGAFGLCGLGILVAIKFKLVMALFPYRASGGEMALQVFWVCGGSKDDLPLDYLKLGNTFMV